MNTSMLKVRVRSNGSAWEAIHLLTVNEGWAEVDRVNDKVEIQDEVQVSKAR